MINRICIIFFLFLIPFLGFSQTNLTKPNLTKLSSTNKQDTIYVFKQNLNNETINEYQDILEKTNMQLSLWWNPYAILIGSLGVLFTFLTIISAVIIYRQSREYRNLINESLKKHESYLNELINEKNEQLNILENNLTNLIAEYKQKSKTLGKESSEELKNFLTKLEQQKEFIDRQKHPKFVTPKFVNSSLESSYSSGILEKHHTCKNCDYGFIVKDNILTISSIPSSVKIITCPNCGNVERLY